MAERYSISSSNKEQKKPEKTTEKPRLFSNPTSLAFFISLVVSVLIIAGLLSLVFSYRAKINTLEADKVQLQKQIDELKKQAASSSTNGSSAQSSGIVVPPSVKQTVQSAIESKNYSQLQSKLASSVVVVIVGSGSSTQSAAQAIAALNYLTGASGSWSWSGSTTQYQSGPYGQYFGDNAVVGTSSNGYVVSATVNENGQIDTILVSSNTTDLAQVDTNSSD